MAALDAHFTEEELTPVRRGIRTFIRLTGLISHEFQYRWFADEADAVSFLKSIVTTFQKTERMIGKSKYQGQPFDPIRQVSEDMAALMLTGHTETTTIANAKRYSPLYYLVIEPVIRLFAKFDHQTAIALADEITDAIAQLITDCSDYGSYEDALVAQEQTRFLVRQREEAIKVLRSTRKRQNRKKVIEVIEESDELVEP